MEESIFAFESLLDGYGLTQGFYTVHPQQSLQKGRLSLWTRALSSKISSQNEAI